MLYPLHARRVFAIGVAVLALSGAAAKADVIYTVTTTGTISSGDSHGIFGANGTNLAGMTYTATQTFDATLSTFHTDFGPGTQALNPAYSSASITVGGQTYNMAAASSDPNQYFIASMASGSTDDLIQSDTVNSYSYTQYLTIYIDTTTAALTYLSNDSLSQTLTYVPVSGLDSNGTDFLALDGSNFQATVSMVTLNGGTSTPVPEPPSIALFGAGLAGLAWLRRRKPA